jgi:hypothetical protein
MATRRQRVERRRNEAARAERWRDAAAQVRVQLLAGDIRHRDLRSVTLGRAA